MNASVKDRLLWLMGIIFFLLFTVSIFALVGMAFMIPEPSLATRLTDVLMVLLAMGLFAFSCAVLFAKAGYSDDKILEAMPVRLYLTGLVPFAIIFALFWLHG
jgi:hypothetical protein